MTRPNKYRARFGDRYRIPGGERYLPAGFNIRKFGQALLDAMPAIRRMTEAFRQVADNMRRARETDQTTRQVAASFGTHSGGDAVDVGTRAADMLRQAGWAMWQRPPEGLELGEDGRYRARPSDILDRIDDTLLTYDSQHATGETPWPYRGF